MSSEDRSLIARNRRERAANEEPKTSRFPRTSRRQQRVEAVLARRQTTLSVVLEDIHDAHNVSAVLRSCDATGVLDVHLVYVVDAPPRKAFHRTTSASAAKWVNATFHDSIGACYAHLRAGGAAVLATTVGQGGCGLFDADLTQPVALVFGNEMRGLSDRAIGEADETIEIPMMGMVESLNISVACAVVLYEALRQRLDAGFFDSSAIPPDELSAMRDDWLTR